MSLSASATLTHCCSLGVVYEQPKLTTATFANSISKVGGNSSGQIAIAEKLGSYISLLITVTVLFSASK
jgi:hypothetical protein